MGSFFKLKKKTVNSCHCIQLTPLLLFNSLTGEEKKMCGYCMQCSGTAHNVNLPLASLEEEFWPAVYN
jgi:hypothetical protein